MEFDIMINCAGCCIEDDTYDLCKGESSMRRFRLEGDSQTRGGAILIVVGR